jgi:hypothetical protein
MNALKVTVHTHSARFLTRSGSALPSLQFGGRRLGDRRLKKTDLTAEGLKRKSPPVRGSGVADDAHRRTAELRRRWHSAPHHDQFAIGTGVAHHRRRIVREDPGHRRQVSGHVPTDLDTIKLTREREITPYVWVHPSKER